MSRKGSRKILLVDDNETLLMAMEFKLREAGYEVFTARDGREALAVVQEQVPDVTVSDISMPVMDGFELCEKLRSDPRYASMPFIFLTAHGEPEERVRGLEAGAEDFIVKPFRIEELIARIERIYRRLDPPSHHGRFQGNLEDLGLPDILQTLEQKGKSGRLVILSQGRKGFLDFRKGRILAARFGDAAGEDALVELFNLQQGEFWYEHRELEDGDLQLPISSVLIDIARLSDEARRWSAWMPNPGDRLVWTSEERVGDPELAPYAAVLHSESLTVRDLAEKMGRSLIRTRVAAARLHQEGRLRVEPGSEDAAITGGVLRLLVLGDGWSSLQSLLAALGRPKNNANGGSAMEYLRVTVDRHSVDLFLFDVESDSNRLWMGMIPLVQGVLRIMKDETRAEPPAIPKTLDGAIPIRRCRAADLRESLAPLRESVRSAVTYVRTRKREMYAKPNGGGS